MSLHSYKSCNVVLLKITLLAFDTSLIVSIPGLEDTRINLPYAIIHYCKTTSPLCNYLKLIFFSIICSKSGVSLYVYWKLKWVLSRKLSSLEDGLSLCSFYSFFVFTG